MYDPLMVKPMRDEAVEIGFKEVYTPEEVKEQLGKSRNNLCVRQFCLRIRCRKSKTGIICGY